MTRWNLQILSFVFILSGGGALFWMATPAEEMEQAQTSDQILAQPIPDQEDPLPPLETKTPVSSQKQAPAEARAASAQAEPEAVSQVRQSWQGYKECLQDEVCDVEYSKERPAQYYDVVGMQTSKFLQSVAEKVRRGDLPQKLAEDVLAESLPLSMENEHIFDGSLDLLDAIPADPARVDQVLHIVGQSVSPSLYVEAMEVMEKHAGTKEDARLQDFLYQSITSGPNYAAQEMAKNSSLWMSETRVAQFEEALIQLSARSRTHRYLRMSLKEMKSR